MEKEILEEIVIKGDNIIRIYSVEEWKEYFNDKEYVSIEEIIKTRLRQNYANI